MLYAYVERFDVMGERGNILDSDEEVNKSLVNLNRDGAPTNHSMSACVSRVSLPRTELV
jgi:hypothetical protein